MTLPAAFFHQETGLNLWQWPGNTGGPGFLCLHSMPWNGLQWSPVAARLAGRRPLTAPDLPGLGRSELRTPVEYEAFADLLARWMEPSGPLILVGASWGCWQSLCLAARHPELVAGVVLTDGGFWNPPAWRPGTPPPTLPTFPDRDGALAHARREAPYDWTTWDGELGPCLELRFREEGGSWRMNFEPETLQGYFKAIATAPWQEWLPQVRAPLLVLACHLDYPPQARQHKEAGLAVIRQVRPDAIIEEYEDRAHLAHQQDPAWFTERILTFAQGAR